MSWFNTLGPTPEYVIFSKVKYIRNLAKLPFYRAADPKRAEEELSRIDKLLVSNGFKCERISSGKSPYVLALAEKHFADKDTVDSTLARSIYLNEPCNLSVTLGGRDIISLSSVMSGLSIIEAKNIAKGVEELIDRSFDLAYDERIGYLSPDIHRCGSGLELSCAVFLPSLRREGSYESLRSYLSSRSFNIYPMLNYREGCDIYIISHVPHHLANEEASVSFFSSAIENLIEHEKNRVRIIFSSSGKDIVDAAVRATAILSYSLKLGESELISLLSDIRLALIFGGDSLPKALPEITDLNMMLAEGLNFSVISGSTKKCASESDVDELRSELIGGYLRRAEGA